ncbi:MAG: chemotaxis protein CheD [Bryobacteraceae bacterium]
MTQIVVGVADCRMTKDRGATLVTYALGSCVGIGVFDRLDARKAGRNPWMFADTGVAQLVDRCIELGAAKARLRVWLAGGSSVMDERGVFNIGKRNQLAVRKALWKAGLLTLNEDMGGQGSRTVRLVLETGTFWIRAAGTDQELKAKTSFTRGV